jgi:hypothetical protein
MSAVKLTRRDAAKMIIPLVYEGADCCTPPAAATAV